MRDRARSEFEAMVQRSYDRLPAPFREATRHVLIRVQDRADDEILTAMKISDPMGLLGLYHGIDVLRKSVFDSGVPPDLVMLYREPILAHAERQGLDAEQVVSHVLVHELGHHFGFSDEEMHEIENGA